MTRVAQRLVIPVILSLGLGGCSGSPARSAQTVPPADRSDTTAPLRLAASSEALVVQMEQFLADSRNAEQQLAAGGGGSISQSSSINQSSGGNSSVSSNQQTISNSDGSVTMVQTRSVNGNTETLRRTAGGTAARFEHEKVTQDGCTQATLHRTVTGATETIEIRRRDTCSLQSLGSLRADVRPQGDKRHLSATITDADGHTRTLERDL